MRGIFKRNNDEKLTDVVGLGIPIDVIEISIQSCRVTNIPKDYFMKFILLETLNLQNNYIAIIPDLPPNVTYLNISYNRLVEFNIDAVNNQRLEVLDLKYNLIQEIPVIQNKPEGLIIHYKGNNRNYDAYNELDFFAQQALERRIGRNIRGGALVNNLEQMKEAANVHDSAIQSNTHKSIEYLLDTIPTQEELEYYPDKWPFRYDHFYCLGIIGIYSSIIVDEMTCMQKLFGNSGNLILNHRTILKQYDESTTTIMYDYGRDKGCTMSQILERIWVNSKVKKRKLSNGQYVTEPRSADEQKSIISNLVIQMLDGQDVCFVGKFTRVVSSLVSFDENIKLEISFPIRFGNAVDYFKAKGEYNRDNLIRFVEESELEPHEKRTWIQSINDMFEDEVQEAAEVAKEDTQVEKVTEIFQKFVPFHG
jgi:hypothetical protein